ncbi:MAG: hypothetical protein D6822_02175 [Cyanobacteria bacterium J149]|nr:MAG: hypothetical protein D6822_02175 [Cyanobacteria bacterium J149]
MKLQLNSKSKVRGYVVKKKYDSKKLELVKRAVELGLPKKDIDFLERWASKPLFKENVLWKLFHKLFNLDLKIPVLFGNWTLDGVAHNTITDVGKQISAQQVGGTTTTPVTAIAIGTGTPTTTALGAEIARAAATVTNTTTTTTGDTEQWVHTFSFSGSYAITEEGLFDNNTSGGNMLASQSFSAINVTSGDSLQITHKVVYS